MSRASRSSRRNRWRAYQGISGDCTTMYCRQRKAFSRRKIQDIHFMRCVCLWAWATSTWRPRFFLRFDHIFEMFLTRRLDFMIVRLFALHMSFVIKREEISQIAVADPYYMHESFLSLGDYERKTAREYIENFMVMNKEKEMVLVPYHPM